MQQIRRGGGKVMQGGEQQGMMMASQAYTMNPMMQLNTNGGNNTTGRMPKLMLPNDGTTAICRCRVLYLGSSVPHITKDGLQGIQEPLRELYPDQGPYTAKGIDSWLSVWSNGLLLENVDESRRQVTRFFPIDSLHYCAAVRYVVVPGTSGTEKVEKFLPLDSPFARNANPNHPPVFACILRRTAGIKVLECHAFICKKEPAANALVRCCFHAYADSMYAKQLDENPYYAESTTATATRGNNSRSILGIPDTVQKVEAWRNQTEREGPPPPPVTVNGNGIHHPLHINGHHPPEPPPLPPQNGYTNGMNHHHHHVTESMNATPKLMNGNGGIHHSHHSSNGDPGDKIVPADENHKVWNVESRAEQELVYVDVSGTLRSMRSGVPPPMMNGGLPPPTPSVTGGRRPRQMMMGSQVPPPPPSNLGGMMTTKSSKDTTKSLKKLGKKSKKEAKKEQQLLQHQQQMAYDAGLIYAVPNGFRNGAGGPPRPMSFIMGGQPPNTSYAGSGLYTERRPRRPERPPLGPGGPHTMVPSQEEPLYMPSNARALSPVASYQPGAFPYEQYFMHYSTAPRPPKGEKGAKKGSKSSKSKKDQQSSDDSPFNTGIYKRKGHLNERAFSYSIRQEHRSRSSSLSNLHFLANGEEAGGHVTNGHHHVMNGDDAMAGPSGYKVNGGGGGEGMIMMNHDEEAAQELVQMVNGMSMGGKIHHHVAEVNGDSGNYSRKMKGYYR